MLSTYNGFLTLGLIGFMLMIGIFLRAKVKVFQNYMIPSAILGGVAGFILINSGITGFTSKDFLPFTMHAFNISFMSLCLTNPDPNSSMKSSRREYLRGGMWLTLVWTASFGLQAIVGALAISGYNIFSGDTLSTAYGFLSTHGFTQGPGQGMAIGGIWEETYGTADASIIGLIYANIGFLAAFLAGVPVARKLVASGKNTNKKASISTEFLKGIYTNKKEHVVGHETTHSSNVDTFAVHIAVLGIAYFITYHWLTFAGEHFGAIPGIGNLTKFGFFFLNGLAICLIIRFIMNKLGCSDLLDTGVQKHMTGAAVDFMLAASIMSINLAVLTAYIVPILIVSISIAVATFFMIWFFSTHLNHLAPERTVATLGCCYGSTANGLLLLRILDPDYSTSVSLELAFFNVALTVTCFAQMGILGPSIPGISPFTAGGWYLLSVVLACTGLMYLSRMQIDKATAD